MKAARTRGQVAVLAGLATVSDREHVVYRAVVELEAMELLTVLAEVGFTVVTPAQHLVAKVAARLALVEVDPGPVRERYVRAPGFEEGSHLSSRRGSSRVAKRNVLGDLTGFSICDHNIPRHVGRITFRT